jgi:sugar-specific transcriptional regulator TrmB
VSARFTGGSLLELRSYEIQTLKELGLSILQARAYLALARLGSAKVNTISKFSCVARSDLYRTLNSLQELGLVEKVISSPLQFRAAPLDQGLLLLLKRRNREQRRLRSKTLRLVREFKDAGKAVSSEADGSKFVLVPSGNLLLEKIKAAVDQSQKGIDLLLSWRRFLLGVTDAFAEVFERAFGRNVKFRFIVDASEEEAVAKRVLQLCRGKPNCQFRFIHAPPDYVFSIYDKKEAFIIVDPKANLPDSPALWTNNPSLISLIRDYFEILWFTSSEKHNFEPPRKESDFEDRRTKEFQII